MKSILLGLLVTFSMNLNGQYLDSLTYQQANDPQYFPNVSNGTTVRRYVSSDGSAFKLKDTLLIGKPIIGTQKAFEYIILGKALGAGNLLAALSGEGPDQLPLSYSGQKVLVEEIRVAHDGSKKKPLIVSLLLGDVNGRAFGVNKYLSVSDYELAFAAKEIRPKNQAMTRAEAIAKLKESKELLDLGIISQEQFDKLKVDLGKIITKQ